MGLFSKKKKKDREYQSEEAQDLPDPEFSKKKDPYLVIGNAPPRPAFGGKGLDSDTVYQYQSSEADYRGPDLGPTEPTGNVHNASITIKHVVRIYVVSEACISREMPTCTAGVPWTVDTAN